MPSSTHKDASADLFSVEKVVKRDSEITNEIFIKSFDKDVVEDEDGYAILMESNSFRSRIRLSTKIVSEYENAQEYIPKKKSKKREAAELSKSEDLKVETIPEEEATKIIVEGTHAYPSAPGVPLSGGSTRTEPNKSAIDLAVKALKEKERQKGPMPSSSIVAYKPQEEKKTTNALVLKARDQKVPVPEWHAPWKLSRVIAGHLGWVRCIAMDVSNEWFATGSADRTIKVWDLASGNLKLTLTGHSHTVRGVAISSRSPYLFSCGEDKAVKCWDLERNEVIRSYHGHLSGVYCVTTHPTLDLLFTGGRDSVVRVWDIRTKAEVMVLGGHKGTIHSVATQAGEPQVVTGSADATVRTWDLVAGTTTAILTHHKKGVRSVLFHPEDYVFATASADNIKKWKCPNAEFLGNISGHNYVLNTISVNRQGLLFAGGDNGMFRFCDWKTGYCFQEERTVVQPGSLDSEAGIFASTFDLTGTRLITCEADKSIKVSEGMKNEE
ncbi:hypothetical protein JH06_4788 [Blastocystis sp. subtype 4]|uniref:hypothetical protein n=1 Tax=Blastocystis sp. subtype 4 TaxID=944170 RepID=UPI000711A852|nr:hypothetical protein JH06_4788 [Blastocystis sp. subtype 4]KNB42821.1 hypothetical protein JH06_4788 [Blastocystis sp. subtype 4]|eukprot:XP_014526264.1 hypothetical protein JH06_4788 [Blastocystis sp. subtype 4]